LAGSGFWQSQIEIAGCEMTAALTDGLERNSHPEQDAGFLTNLIDVRDITLPERHGHPSRRSGVVRGHEQVDVMGHQYECMNAAALPSRVILKPVQIEAILSGR
jgi:hypothetical protein